MSDDVPTLFDVTPVVLLLNVELLIFSTFPPSIRTPSFLLDAVTWVTVTLLESVE